MVECEVLRGHVSRFNVDCDLSLFKIEEVSFIGSLISDFISDDVAVIYEAPHWRRAENAGVGGAYPLASVRNTRAAAISERPSGLLEL